MSSKAIRTGVVVSALAVVAFAVVVVAQNFNPAKRLAKELKKKVENRDPTSENSKPKPKSKPKPQPKKLTVDEIISKTNYVAYYQGRDGRAKISMTVVDRQGRQRQKELIILRWDRPAPKPETGDDRKPETRPGKKPSKADDRYCGQQKFYVYFQSPPDDNKTTFLVWKHLDKDDDRWLYLPNLDLVKRIAATDKRTSLVGSHFFYEDISGRNISDDKHELLKTTKAYYVLRNTPKKPKTVEFAYYDMYILKDSFLPVHIWYYDRNKKKYRTYSVLKWDLDKTFGYATVHKARMSDSNIGGYTDLEYTGVKYNIPLPERLFTERFLKRTPYRYLK